MGNVPAWPVKVACGSLAEPLSQLDLLKGIHEAAQVYYNSTGDMKCLDLNGGGDTPDLGYVLDSKCVINIILTILSQSMTIVYSIDYKLLDYY